MRGGVLPWAAACLMILAMSRQMAAGHLAGSGSSYASAPSPSGASSSSSGSSSSRSCALDLRCFLDGGALVAPRDGERLVDERAGAVGTVNKSCAGAATTCNASGGGSSVKVTGNSMGSVPSSARAATATASTASTFVEPLLAKSAARRRT
ncbi:hypothetical protein PF002_g18805 [Phytophthora fragariae]|uniref:Pectate lyase n=1 Tax=Phytophthora fragariae TaxID=53985 RepID=A0A6A3Y3A1_9STRA|nr:hypothetical protein PF002_g18805 [Phytophthora fragariae]